jgi:hypothetical protein
MSAEASPNTADIVERLLAPIDPDADPRRYPRNPDGLEAAAIITELREAVRISAQAFRTLEEVAVANLEHDKARNFIKLGNRCRAALKDHRKAQA